MIKLLGENIINLKKILKWEISISSKTQTHLRNDKEKILISLCKNEKEKTQQIELPI